MSTMNSLLPHSISALVLSMVLAACTPGNADRGNGASRGAADSGVPKTERVAAIALQLERAGRLPSALNDAHFVEEKVGDGVLGPSEFSAFYALTVPATDIPAWRAALAVSPVLNGPAAYAAPKAAAPWWVSREDFGKLELFGPKLFTGRVNGWVGIAPDGHIFIHAFTM